MNIMKYLKLFENFNQVNTSLESIADELNNSAKGLGTNEDQMVSAITKIQNKETLLKLNDVLKGSQFEYHTVGEFIRGELGMLDSDAKNKITAHLKKIGAESLIDQVPNKTVKSEVSIDSIINQIMERVIKHEGYKPEVYKDTKGIPTVGVGFNLSRKDSAQRLKSVGADFQAVLSGRQKLTDSQIKSLLKQDLMTAANDAKSLVKNFSSLPMNVQGVLTEMVFNLGKTGLSKFSNFLNNIYSNNFQAASSEMLNSAWAKQVGARANTLAQIIKTT